MTFDPVSPSPRFRVQPWMIGAGVAVVAVGGLAFVLLRGGSADGFHGSDQMQVEVVAPVEPEIQPGATMEVGPLVDGYTHVALPAQGGEEEIYVADYETPWVEPLPPLREVSTVAWRSDGGEEDLRPRGEVTRSDGSRFGFDQPSPDYAAERRARQERLDRIQADQASRGRPGTPVAGPDLDRESAFY
ncbi:hypothetical protein [Brevundimonas sp. GCM10030266]|uniref:hypothetical protein n=1 Tax=Brevundimonas sp. GCM10030266 TaxID=3273386 RepID=UPI00360A0A4B